MLKDDREKKLFEIIFRSQTHLNECLWRKETVHHEVRPTEQHHNANLTEITLTFLHQLQLTSSQRLSLVCLGNIFLRF